MKKDLKKNILVSFSGGETSAYLINWLQINKKDHNLIYVFANTGEENEETLLFVKKCQDYFKIKINWIEFDILNNKPFFKEVSFETAYRSHSLEAISENYENHPFKKVIERYGLPSRMFPHCSRDLKERVIRRFMKDKGYKKNSYDIAIGIRADEIDRVKAHYYPLVSAGITKPLINAFWRNMPFRLELKGYQGNCKTCWKKSFRKLGTISLENPEKFDFFKVMEEKFQNTYKENSKNKKNPLRFFRENKSVKDVFKIPKKSGFEIAVDDSIDYNYQTSILHDGTELDTSNGCIESCEVF